MQLSRTFVLFKNIFCSLCLFQHTNGEKASGEKCKRKRKRGENKEGGAIEREVDPLMLTEE